VSAPRYTSGAGAIALGVGTLASIGGFWSVLGTLLVVGAPQLRPCPSYALVALALTPLTTFALALAVRPAWFAVVWWIDGGLVHFHVPGRGGGWTRALPAARFVTLETRLFRTRARRDDGTTLSLPRTLQGEKGELHVFRLGSNGELAIARGDSRPG